MHPQHAEDWYRRHLFYKKKNQKLYDAALAAYKLKTKKASASGFQLALLMPKNQIHFGRGHRVSRPPKQFEVSERNRAQTEGWACCLGMLGMLGMFGHVGHVGHVWACLGTFGHVGHVGHVWEHLLKKYNTK